MAIQDDDGPGSDHGIHCDNLLGVGADGEESLPVCALQGWAGAIFLQAGRGDVNGLNDRSGADLGFIHRGGRRDNRDFFNGIGRRRRGGCTEFKGHDLIHREVLSGEDAVEPGEREGALAIEEVRDVCLTETRLPSEAGAGEAAEFDTAEEFATEKLVEILEIHREEFSCCRTISFCMTNIKQIIYFAQCILDNLVVI